MDSLPLHLVEEILFRLDPISLVMMQCTDKSINSHISNDPDFVSEYLSRAESTLVHMSSIGSNYFFCRSTNSSLSRSTEVPISSQILGSCSGLLLLSIDGLCVVNPLTKRFRFLDHSESNLKLEIVGGKYRQDKLRLNQTNRIGFAVDQIDQTTQRFKIVCLIETIKASNPVVTIYQFEINSGDSPCRLSRTTITCRSSNFMTGMKPVYVNGSLHWLRNDGSIIAFDPETERAEVIVPINFPQELSLKILFAAADNELTLISATKEAIYVYALENMVTDSKWVLVRQIGIGMVDETGMKYLNVAAYDGKSLVVIDRRRYNGVVREYDVTAKEWGVMGSIERWCDSDHDYYQLTPSLSSVIGLDDHEKMEMSTYDDDDKRFSSLSSIMRLISKILPYARKPLNKKTQLGKRLIDIEETIMRLQIDQEASREVGGINKRRRVK